jgi:hypothetical protein
MGPHIVLLRSRRKGFSNGASARRIGDGVGVAVTVFSLIVYERKEHVHWEGLFGDRKYSSPFGVFSAFPTRQYGRGYDDDDDDLSDPCGAPNKLAASTRLLGFTTRKDLPIDVNLCINRNSLSHLAISNRSAVQKYFQRIRDSSIFPS